MSDEYYWSPTTLSFYDASIRWRYEAAGSFPKDVVPVSLETFLEFSNTIPPDGKKRGVVDGRPGWVDLKPTTSGTATHTG